MQDILWSDQALRGKTFEYILVAVFPPGQSYVWKQSFASAPDSSSNNPLSKPFKNPYAYTFEPVFIFIVPKFNNTPLVHVIVVFGWAKPIYASTNILPLEPTFICILSPTINAAYTLPLEPEAVAGLSKLLR